MATGENPNSGDPKKQKQRETRAEAWPVFVALVLIEEALLVKLFLVAEVSTALVTAITVIAGLIILSLRAFDLTSLSVSKDGLEAELRDVKQKLVQLDEGVQQVRNQVALANPASFVAEIERRKAADGSEK